MAPVTVARGWLRKGIKGVWAFAWPVMLTILLAVLFMMMITYLFGDLEHFKQWQKTHYRYMLTWRMMIYAAIGIGWFRMRSRLKRQYSDTKGRSALMRCEYLVIAVVVLLELMRAGVFTSVGTV